MTADANLDELIAAYESRGCLRNALRDPEYRPYCLRCNDLVRMEKREPLLWQCVRCLAVHDLQIDGDVLTALRRCRDAEGERDAEITAAVAAERDACRKIADEQVALIETLQASYEGMPPIQGLARECARTARSIRDAIEARGEEPTNG